MCARGLTVLRSTATDRESPVSDFSRAVLDAVGVQSYAELVELNTEEVIRRLDEHQPPLHPSDAFLAVLVLSAVSELRETAKALDAAKRGI